MPRDPGAHPSKTVEFRPSSLPAFAPRLEQPTRQKVHPHIADVATLFDVTLDALPNAFPRSLAHARGVSDRSLRRLVAEGTLERLGHGLYRKTDAPPADLDRVEIALRSPDATLCLTTALSHHDLTDVIPAEIDVALPRSRRRPRVHAPVRWHRFHEDTFHLGRETLQVDEGLTLGIYGADRCIVDAFRLRHQEGEELAIEALRRWLARPWSTPAGLLTMAKHFPKAEPSLLSALRVLV